MPRRMIITGFVFLSLALNRPARSQQVLYQWDGEADSAFFGQAIACAGDLDGDGFDEVIVGAPQDIVAQERRGSAFVYSGRTGLSIFSFHGEGAGDLFGVSVAAAGDVNADAVTDILIGAPYNDVNGTFSGRSYVYSGADGCLLWTIDGESASDQFGTAVAGGLDADRDGFADLLISSPKKNSTFKAAGRIYVFSGRSATLLRTIDGSNIQDELGRSLAVLDDVNADGIADFVTAGLQHPTVVYLTGHVTVYCGGTGAVLYDLVGEHYNNVFGESVADAGDVDADGVGDFAVGALRWRQYTYGRLYVYSGTTGTTLFEYSRAVLYSEDALGASVAGLGDVNGDGFSDVIVGAPLARNPEPKGEALVLLGPSGSLLLTLEGEASADQFGAAVSSAGDIDHDGRAEIMCAAPLHGSAAPYGGRVYVYRGITEPKLFGVEPARGLYRSPGSVTIRGDDFSFGQNTQVTFDSAPADNVQVVDDGTITCIPPVGLAGTSATVSVSNENGSASNSNAFLYTPSMATEGQPRPGEEIDLHYLCEPGDSILAIFGLPEAVDLHVRPYDGSLCILPIQLLFFLPEWRLDQFTLRISIPDDPGLSGAEVLLQALIGPDLTDHGEPGSFTNCLMLEVE